MQSLTNTLYDELRIGQAASLSRTLTAQDIVAFAGVSGDVNPAHLDHDYANRSPFEGVIGHGMWTGALVSTLLGTKLPGPGTIYVAQSFSFRAPVRVGDTLDVTITVREKRAGGRVLFDCAVTNQEGADVLSGEAEVIAPGEKTTVPAPEAPVLLVGEVGDRLLGLVQRAKRVRTLTVGVVHPVDRASLAGAMDAVREQLVSAVLIGPEHKIRRAADEAGIDISGSTIIDAPHSHAAGETAAAMAGRGELDALMKGALHTDEILAPVLDRQYQLRTERRLSHCYLMDAPAYHKLLVITDAAVNITPSLAQKADILRNAGDLCRAIGVPQPKAAILSAIETVNADIPSTLDAAALCKMVDRGQIKGILADGPLALDNAISAAAVKAKGIVSDVAGDPDILLVPDLVSGNMLAKQLDYLGGAVAAGIVLGARVPIILTSRAEGRLPRLASCALACLLADAQP